MAVMAGEAWTDERLDDLAKRVDRGFDEVKVEVRDLRLDTGKGFDGVKGEVRDLRADMDRGLGEVKGEVRDLHADMKKGFERVDEDFREINRRFESMQRMMIISFITLFASIAASVIGGIVATQL